MSIRVNKRQGTCVNVQGKRVCVSAELHFRSDKSRHFGGVSRSIEADSALVLVVLFFAPIKAANTSADQPQTPEHRRPCCGERMIIIERFERGATPRSHPSPPTPVIRIDTS